MVKCKISIKILTGNVIRLVDAVNFNHTMSKDPVMIYYLQKVNVT